MRQKILLVLVLLGALVVVYVKRADIKQMFGGDTDQGPGYPVPAIKATPANPDPEPEPAPDPGPDPQPEPVSPTTGP